MKTKEGFNLREICGEYMIIAEGKQNIDFSNIISMNETAAYLWKKVQGKDFNAETLADLLIEEYEVNRETALADSAVLIEKWLQAGIIE